MKRTLFLVLSLFSLPISVWAEGPWASFLVPESSEAETLARLGDAGIPSVSWSTAVVEVSAFEGLETIPVSQLGRRLTPQDPRWDPWLRSVVPWFEPRHGLVPIWVPGDKASGIQGWGVQGEASPSQGITPPVVTGWTLIVLALLATSVYLTAGFRSGWPGWDGGRPWLWAPVCLAVLLAGAVLVIPRGGTSGAPPVAAASWLQHRWFQEAWPWGARWDDYAPDRAWTFRSYERKDGKLAEVDTRLTAADQSWAEAALGGLDPHHAARIFGSGNP